mmetsp:Transcript_2700/g.7374  ORF Transcript_2700/g.7374 Transcript_2700/m.7374 type:complete len:276 (+) Transcript_2700:197-1024(+)
MKPAAPEPAAAAAAVDEDVGERDELEAVESELAALRQERRMIVDEAHVALGAELAELRRRQERRMRLAADQRTYHLRAAENAYRVDVQNAWDEFYAARIHLRDEILRIRLERERRVDLLQPELLRNKRAKKRSAQMQVVERWAATGDAPALMPEGGRLNRFIALSPDEIHSDLQHILEGVEGSRGITPQPYTASLQADIQPVIHASHGKLFFFDDVLEKGNLVAVHSKTDNLRFNARITVVQPREVHLAATNGKQYCVLVAHLRSGKTIIKRRTK